MVEARRERSEGERRVHLCNAASISPRVSPALHCAIAFTTGWMGLAVAPPVVGVPAAPCGLGPGLICPVVGIDAHAFLLLGPSSDELAGLR